MFPKMETSEVPGLTEKSSRNFYCTYCDYLTSRKSNYKKHLLTLKHQKVAKKTGGNTILTISEKVARGTNLLPEPDKKNVNIGDMTEVKSSKKVAKNSEKVARGTNLLPDHIKKYNKIGDMRVGKFRKKVAKSSKKVAKNSEKVARGTKLLSGPIKKNYEIGDMHVEIDTKKSTNSAPTTAMSSIECGQQINFVPINRQQCRQSIEKGYNCGLCNKYYKSRSGCYKHEKVCGHRMSQLEKKISELEGSAVNEKIGMQNNTINNTINNNITIQLFLDENCKNAMPLESFVKNLQITMEDLFNSNRIGYVDGLSSIIVKNLQELEVTRRPIHCSDPEQLKFYVKSEKEWKKDNGDIVGKAVESVKKGVNGTVSEYMKMNDSSEAEELEVMKVLQTINKIPSSVIERNQIIKNIGDSVILNDAFDNDLSN